MMTDSPPRFRFKFGEVIVTPEQLVIEQGNLRGRFSNAIVGRSTGRSWVVRILLTGLLLWIGVSAILRGELVSGAFMLAIAGWLLYFQIRNRNYSLDREIARSSVTRVQAIRGIRFVTLDRLAIHFDDPAGRSRQRFINMPTTLQGGGPWALDQAVQTLRAAGWPVDP